ncbi:MAG: arsenosugar biosynthesis-associated peroxidase-like protein [Bacteroidota bacterium]
MIKDLQHISGRVLVFGGIYSNLHALEALYRVAQHQDIPPENIICTGDMAGYCAFPDECYHFLEDWGIHAILGNVEENLRDGLTDCGCGFGEDSRCDLFARMWYPYAQRQTGERALAYIKTLPAKLRFTYAGQTAMVLHGSYQETAEFIWASTDWATKSTSFQAAEADLILGGHCGLPFVDAQNGKTWLNAGVIGMPPNDGTTKVWYAILNDTDEKLSYTFHPLEYDYTAARAAMLERPLPKSYALTLKTGIWDNTEIMPPAEAAQEGISITSESLVRTQKNTLPKTNGRLLRDQPLATLKSKKLSMSNQYYDPKDLKRFGQINDYQPEMGKQFFDWYENATHGDTALTQREKSLIALAVSHAIQCPYCIDAYTTGSLESGADEEQMMEAVHVAAAIKAGTTLIYGLQMKRQIEKLTM